MTKNDKQILLIVYFKNQENLYEYFTNIRKNKKNSKKVLTYWYSHDIIIKLSDERTKTPKTEKNNFKYLEN